MYWIECTQCILHMYTCCTIMIVNHAKHTMIIHWYPRPIMKYFGRYFGNVLEILYCDSHLPFTPLGTKEFPNYFSPQALNLQQNLLQNYWSVVSEFMSSWLKFPPVIQSGRRHSCEIAIALLHVEVDRVNSSTHVGVHQETRNLSMNHRRHAYTLFNCIQCHSGYSELYQEPFMNEIK